MIRYCCVGLLKLATQACKDYLMTSTSHTNMTTSCFKQTNKQTNRPMKNAIVASLYNAAKVWPSFAVYLYICYTVRPPHSIFPLLNPAILSIIELNTAVKMPNKSMFIEHCGAITSPLWQPHWKWQPQTFC